MRFFERLGTLLTASLARETKPVEQMEEYAQLQALCAHAYQLRASEFEHILGTFPLIPAGVTRGSSGFVQRHSLTSRAVRHTEAQRHGGMRSARWRRQRLTYRIIGCAHGGTSAARARADGSRTAKQALCMELQSRGISFRRQCAMSGLLQGSTDIGASSRPRRRG